MALVKVLSNFPPRLSLRPPAASCCSGDQKNVNKLSDYDAKTEMHLKLASSEKSSLISIYVLVGV